MFKKHVLTRKTTFRLKTQIEAYVLYWVQAYRRQKSLCVPFLGGRDLGSLCPHNGLAEPDLSFRGVIKGLNGKSSREWIAVNGCGQLSGGLTLNSQPGKATMIAKMAMCQWALHSRSHLLGSSIRYCLVASSSFISHSYLARTSAILCCRCSRIFSLALKHMTSCSQRKRWAVERRKAGGLLL